MTTLPRHGRLPKLSAADVSSASLFRCFPKVAPHEVPERGCTCGRYLRGATQETIYCGALLPHPLCNCVDTGLATGTEPPLGTTSGSGAAAAAGPPAVQVVAAAALVMVWWAVP